MSENDWLQTALQEELHYEMNQVWPAPHINYQAIASTLPGKRRYTIMIGRMTQFATVGLLLMVTVIGIWLFQGGNGQEVMQPTYQLKIYDGSELDYTFDYPTNWQLVNIDSMQINDDVVMIEFIFESRDGAFKRTEPYHTGDQSIHLQFQQLVKANSFWAKDASELSDRVRPSDIIIDGPEQIIIGRWETNSITYRTQSSEDVPFGVVEGEITYFDDLPPRDIVFMSAIRNNVRLGIYGFAAVGEADVMRAQLKSLIATLEENPATK